VKVRGHRQASAPDDTSAGTGPHRSRDPTRSNPDPSLPQYRPIPPQRVCDGRVGCGRQACAVVGAWSMAAPWGGGLGLIIYLLPPAYGLFAINAIGLLCRPMGRHTVWRPRTQPLPPSHGVPHHPAQPQAVAPGGSAFSCGSGLGCWFPSPNRPSPIDPSPAAQTRRPRHKPRQLRARALPPMPPAPTRPRTGAARGGARRPLRRSYRGRGGAAAEAGAAHGRGGLRVRGLPSPAPAQRRTAPPCQP
jgi:hypothetical protein